MLLLPVIIKSNHEAGDFRVEEKQFYYTVFTEGKQNYYFLFHSIPYKIIQIWSRMMGTDWNLYLRINSIF